MKKGSFYYRGAKKFVFLAVFFLILVELLTLAFPLLLMEVADVIYGDNATTAAVVWRGVAVLGVIVAIFIVNFFFEFFIAKGLALYMKRMRSDLFEKVQSAPTERINEIGGEQILPTIMNDTDWVRILQRHKIIFMVFFPIGILGSIIMLFLLEPMFAVFALALVPFLLLFFYFNSKRIGRAIKYSIPAFDVMHNEVKEGIVGAKEIRIYGKAKERDKEFASLVWKQRTQTRRTREAHHFNASFTAILFTLTTIAIVMYGAHTMTDVTGIIIINTAIQYMRNMINGTNHIFVLFVDLLPRTKVSKQRIKRIYALPVETSTDGKYNKTEGAQGAHLIFQSVGFKHTNRKTGLSGISFEVQPGTRVVITGGIGSGKSILPALLLQTTMPTTGKISVGGVDISEINPTYYRRNVISYCGQEPEFIRGTIRDNLKLLNPNVTDQEILKYFADIGANDFVKKFGADFLEYQILEHNSLNLSDKKLLNLVRSLLKEAPIYIMDQCVGRIKNEYVSKVMTKLERERKTVLFISQKNIVAKRCDNIYMLKDGKIIASGKHTELIRSNKEYASLFTASESSGVNEVVE